MKRYTKSLLSLFLSVTILFSICIPGFSVSAENMPDISILTLVPDGDVSDSGYLNQIWVDENGRKVDLDYTSVSKRPVSNKVTNLPSYYSSRDEGYCSDVRNQGSTAVCWAFSAVAAAEISLIRQGIVQKTDDIADLSEAHLVWFTHKSLTTDVYDTTFGDGTNVGSPYSSGGDWHRSTFAVARGSGFALEKNYPFYPYSPAKMGSYDESYRYESKATIDGVYIIPSNEKDEIKTAIMTNGAVGVSAAVFTEYLNGNAYYQNATRTTNHQMVIVGWDDRYAVKNFKAGCRPSSPGAWLVKNSYDSTWGDGGYFWISYEEPSLTSFFVQKTSLTNEEENIYQYDGFGYGSIISPRESTGENIYIASIANVFTAEKNEAIESVSFYTEQPDVSYEIEIYKNVTYGADSPIKNGEKFHVTTAGVAKYHGYHKIALDQAVPVSEGESFSVIITMSVPESGGEAIRIPIEGKDFNDGYVDRYYSSERGQSFYTFPGYSWSEATTSEEKYKLNNVCIKAFTVPDNTFEIRTAEEFNAFADRVTNGETFAGKNINLKADIDFGGAEIHQVGSETNPFKGYFLGNGFVLKNGVVNSSSDYSGVFSCVATGGEIRDTGLEKVTVTGDYGVGALCGINDGLINRCYSIGSVSGMESVGGLVGINCGKIKDSYSVCSVNGKADIGSFIGEDDYGECVNCYVGSSSHSIIGNASAKNIEVCDSRNFANGYVAYKLDKGGTSEQRAFKWTKSDGRTTFLRSDDEKIFQVELYDKYEYESTYLYVNAKDDLKALAEAEKPGYSATIYADSKHKVLYTSVPNADILLYVVWEGSHICSENLYFIEGVPADCYNDGILSYYECTCGKWFLDENAENEIVDMVIPPLAHPSDCVIKTESVSAGCETDGNTEYYTCTLCGDVFADEECTIRIYETSIPMTGHSYSDWATETEADCTNEGLKVKTCANCGDRIEEVISATGHSYSDWVTETEADCTNEGLKVKTCANCGDRIEEVISATGHSYNDWVTETEADCTNEGLKVKTCANCGDRIEEVISATGHSYGSWVTETEADCVNDGTKISFCVNCGNKISETIPANGHDYETEYVEATETTMGYTIYVCKNCDDSYISDYIDPITNVNFSCTVISYLSDTETIQLELIKRGETEASYTINGKGKNCEFTFEGILSGAYTVRISKYGHVVREYAIIIRKDMSAPQFEISPVGDVNGDGNVNVRDYAAVLRHIKRDKMLEGYEEECADVDGDGKINVRDYAKILRHVKKTEYLW